MPHKKPVAVLVACSLACFGGWTAAFADGDKPAEPTTAPAKRPTEEGQKKPEVLIYRSPALDKLIARTMEIKEPLATRLESKLVDARLFENRVLIFAAARKSDAC
jgi:hypothetical protein